MPSTAGETSVFTQEPTSSDEKTKSPPEQDESYDDDYSDDNSSSKHLGKNFRVAFPFGIFVVFIEDWKVFSITNVNLFYLDLFILDFSVLTIILLSSLVPLLSTLAS